ncbi:trehalase family glycosidase [Paenibacillus sp. BK720]|uniref:amylo-alpha-1,6-glucosidase n=1 Tax=Paenibacillus sp. BK720 TaxID=2587092 RepID=UPI00141FD43F|nr:trehalase family glycosidase [Paenibacillus sp. BK720]NIK69003.1 glycogen debranching enzyme [Paenibacillus sp. BK720]
MGAESATPVWTNMPDIWGEGALFAFSGLDGATDTRSQFVAAAGSTGYNLLIHTPACRLLKVRTADSGKVRIATGDVLIADTAGGEMMMTYAAWHTLIGHLPNDGAIAIEFADGEGENRDRMIRRMEVRSDGGKLTITEDSANGDVIVLLLAADERTWTLAFGTNSAEATDRAALALKLDRHQVAKERLAIYDKLPLLDDPARARLLKKSVSVMKVNTLSAEASICQMWSTPDRVPHRAMWLWDSVFHSFAMNSINADISWMFLRSVLETQLGDGMIPHMSRVDGTVSSITQPPILAWGVWENFRFTKNRTALEYALPRLERYMEWILGHRDGNHNGLLEWMIEGNPLCRSGESGMDNSPRFDEAVQLDAVDFSSYAAADMKYMSLIAEELGDSERAINWSRRSADMSAKVHSTLWDEEDGFYYDLAMDGSLSKVKYVSGFMPLLLEDIQAARTERLLTMLHDPRHFGTRLPVPSTAVSESSFSTDMWRGPVWLSTNYLVITGLRKQGKEEEARKLAERTIAALQFWYERYGVIFEYFDAVDNTPPPQCCRKGQPLQQYDLRRKIDPIRDFHWSAALTARLLLDYQAMSG